MLLTRKSEGDLLRQGLWSTHAAINQAVAEIEALLLLLRGRLGFS